MLHLTRFLTFPSLIRGKGEPARHSSTVFSVVTATKGSFEMDRFLVTNSKIVKQYNWPGIYNCTQYYSRVLLYKSGFMDLCLIEDGDSSKITKDSPSPQHPYFGLSIVFNTLPFSWTLPSSLRMYVHSSVHNRPGVFGAFLDNAIVLIYFIHKLDKRLVRCMQTHVIKS